MDKELECGQDGDVSSRQSFLNRAENAVVAHVEIGGAKVKAHYLDGKQEWHNRFSF